MTPENCHFFFYLFILFFHLNRNQILSLRFYTVVVLVVDKQSFSHDVCKFSIYSMTTPETFAVCYL